MILPARQDLIDQYGESWTSPEHFVSNGPYKLVEYDAGHILVEKSLAYNGPVQGVFSQIGFDIIPDAADQISAYKNGNVDVLLSTPVTSIMNDPDLKMDLTILPSPGVQYVSFITPSAALSDPLVRKALASAIDRQIILGNVLSTSWRVEATGVIPPELEGYQGSAVGYSYDPTQAQDFLAIVSARTGRVVNVSVTRSSSALPDGNSSNQRPDLVSGVPIYPENKTLDNWLNMAAFKVPANKTWGNLAKNIARGPGVHQWDISLQKKVKISEGHSISFRSEFFNMEPATFRQSRSEHILGVFHRTHHLAHE